MNPNQGGRRPAACPQVDGPVAAGLVSDRGAARLAWALTALSTALLVLAVVLLVLNRDLGFRTLSPHLLVVPGFGVVGLVLAVHRPGHTIGWGSPRNNIACGSSNAFRSYSSGRYG